jgi:hypothetical protein
VKLRIHLEVSILKKEIVLCAMLLEMVLCASDDIFVIYM